MRELENVLERAVALARPARRIAHRPIFPPKLRGVEGEPHAADAPPSPAAAAGRAAATPLRQARAEFEADYIRKVLQANNRNVSRTARALGLSRVMLQKKMKEYGLRDE